MSGDDTLETKRVYADTGESTTLFVATGGGVARVSVSGDIVGEFALVHRDEARDVATADGRLAVATPEDVLVGEDGAFDGTGFGSADAVAYADPGPGARSGVVPVAAGEGRLDRFDPATGAWTALADLEDVRSIDGDLVAAATGVHRLDGSHVGLEGATDVASGVRPLAATESGLYHLANGWVRALEGSFRAVTTREDGVAIAATTSALHRRDSRDGEWHPVELPVDEPVADVAYGTATDGDHPTTYVVTEPGTVLVDAGDGWRSRSLGLPDVRRVAVLYG